MRCGLSDHASSRWRGGGILPGAERNNCSATFARLSRGHLTNTSVPDRRNMEGWGSAQSPAQTGISNHGCPFGNLWLQAIFQTIGGLGPKPLLCRGQQHGDIRNVRIRTLHRPGVINKRRIAILRWPRPLFVTGNRSALCRITEGKNQEAQCAQ